MRTLALCAMLCAAGCLDQLVPGQKAQTTTSSSSPDLAEAAAPPGDLGGPHRGSMHPGADLAGVEAPPGPSPSSSPGPSPMPGVDGGSALAAFGAPCVQNTDCQTGVCAQVNMAMLCTKVCTNLGGTDNACPGPGGVGTGGQCNLKGYCKP